MFDFDVKDLNPDEVQKQIDSVGTLPVGKYIVELANHIAKDVGDKKVDELSFEVIHGPCIGRKVKAALFQSGNTEKTTVDARNQCIRFGMVLGLLAVVPNKKKEGKKDYKYLKQSFEECVGNRAVVQVVHKKSEKDGQEYANVGYFKIWSLDDEEVKDVVKGFNESGTEEEEEEAVNV